MASVSSILAEELWLPLLSDVLVDSHGLSQLEIAIDEVRQVWEVKAQVVFDGHPGFPGELGTVTLLILHVLPVDTAVGELIPDIGSEASDLPIT